MERGEPLGTGVSTINNAQELRIGYIITASYLDYSGEMDKLKKIAIAGASGLSGSPAKLMPHKFHRGAHRTAMHHGHDKRHATASVHAVIPSGASEKKYAAFRPAFGSDKARGVTSTHFGPGA